MRLALLLTAALLAAPARAQFTSSGDQTVTGQMGAGTATPRATLAVTLSSADAYGLRVSSPNGATLMVVDKTGKVGLGVAAPAGLLDVAGSGRDGDIGLQLRAGNSTSTFSSAQVVLAYSTAAYYPHALVTRAVASQYPGNDLSFFLWRSTGQPAAVGTVRVLSLEAVDASTLSVHVLSVGTAPYELVVSNGQSTGGGRVMAATVAAPSSRALKTVTARLGAADEARAYEDVKSLKPARFRYRGKTAPGPVVRGLVFEDSPASIRDERGRAISVEARIANLEMALKSANARIVELEKKVADEEKRGR